MCDTDGNDDRERRAAPHMDQRLHKAVAKVDDHELYDRRATLALGRCRIRRVCACDNGRFDGRVAVQTTHHPGLGSQFGRRGRAISQLHVMGVTLVITMKAVGIVNDHDTACAFRDPARRRH